ncbi:hypothetical protein [Puia dinghuensis]|uniref:Uncharacterized protein n=1 Tax=Puia dinghuensis TaxID=1792502 RepID=A0A8J2XWF9_9BACT|nr:hypothetical protein [Puia dinghuensis]GGB26144.1 hypothetical protein GCM10011511_57650 [Puia dinghuensis]
MKNEHINHLNTEIISFENRQSLQQQLEMLGLGNSSDIFKTATHPFNLLNSGDPPVRGMLMFDTSSDVDRMYTFVVAQSEMNAWYIQSIEAAGFIRSVQHPEGILGDAISYNVQKQALPHKDQIIKDIDEATKIQGIRNRFKTVKCVEKRKHRKL